MMPRMNIAVFFHHCTDVDLFYCSGVTEPFDSDVIPDPMLLDWAAIEETSFQGKYESVTHIGFCPFCGRHLPHTALEALVDGMTYQLQADHPTAESSR